MTNFQIELAGKKIEINSFYRTVEEMCRDYICERVEKADLYITSTEESIEQERKKDVQEKKASEEQLEVLAVYRSIAEELLEHSIFLMHGSVVATNGRAYMFTAASGVGKTTRSMEWVRQIENSIVVNGDKPLLKIKEKEVYACGTPWCGKEKLNTNICLPLSGIILLERAEKSSLQKIEFSSAFPRLLQQTYRPQNPLKMAKTLALLKNMEKKVSFYKYCINLEDMDMKKLYEAVR